MKDSDKFRTWLTSMTILEYPKIKEIIIIECKISTQVFSFWKTGRTKIPPLAKPIIETIAGHKIFEEEQ